MKTCPLCQTSFEVTDLDRQFLAKFDVPEPTKCWTCRRQNRMAFRNERNLYHRTCDLTGKKIVSMYSADKKLVVYDKDAWFGDRWDGLTYGRDFDFNRPFFDQFAELQQVAPRMNLISAGLENSDYVNYVGNSKNCYLIFGSVFAEDCYYGSPYYSRNCLDCERIMDSELCYQCLDSKKLYRCIYLQNSTGCSECVFGFDLQECESCFGCVGLRQKKYYIFNQPHSKEEYQQLILQFNLRERTHFDAAHKKFEELKQKTPHKSAIIIKSEGCIGDKIYESKNCTYAFYADRCEDCRYVNQVIDVKNCMDQEYGEEMEWNYGNMGGYQNNNVRLSLPNVGCHNLTYCDHCYSSHDCFACISLQRKEFCIFNKQYKKDDYETLKAKIIEHMKKTGEWGEYFPMQKSLFAYNESCAYDDLSALSREEVLKRGYPWRDEPADKPTQNITFDETIHQCQQCQKAFRLIPAEVVFYEKMGIPTPAKCSLCRYHDRLKLRNPRLLYSRSCNKCQAPIQTTYSADRPEIVYCEVCYLKEVY